MGHLSMKIPEIVTFLLWPVSDIHMLSVSAQLSIALDRPSENISSEEKRKLPLLIVSNGGGAINRCHRRGPISPVLPQLSNNYTSKQTHWAFFFFFLWIIYAN